MQKIRFLVVPLLALLMVFDASAQQRQPLPEADIAERMVRLFILPYDYWDEGFASIETDWKPAYTPMAIELLLPLPSLPL